MSGTRAAVQTLVVTSLLGLTSGLPSFQNKIPNGDKIPDPCYLNKLWGGVGHKNPLGRGALNTFGDDFFKHNMIWSRALCELDSDGDSRTNGEELGDPNCQWTEGQIPFKTSGLSHPGVCEPLNSTTCRGKNALITCGTGEFNCPAIKRPDVFNVTLRFAHTNVPAKVTNYFCQIFNLPEVEDYHLIANVPLLNNTHVMHHMLLFGCDEKQKATNAPTPCEMAGEKCTSIIGGWTFNLPGVCLPDNVGLLVGKTGYKSVVLQTHWNNPEKKKDYFDSSGMVLYLTASKRKEDAGVLMVGQRYLEIPPAKERHPEVATIPGSCTNMLVKKDFYVVSGINHMHYLGRHQRVEVFRDCQKVANLTYDEEFSYDKPRWETLKTQVLVKKGDEIKTTCVFNSTSHDTTTFYGEATDDEMCFSFLTYYPKDALRTDNVVNWKSIDTCQRENMKVGECEWGSFVSGNNANLSTFMQAVLDKCNSRGSCRAECRAAVSAVRQHPCFQGDVGDFVMGQLSKHDLNVLPFLQAAQTCPEEFKDPTRNVRVPPPTTCPPGTTNAATVPLGGVLCTLLTLFNVVFI